MNVVSEIHAAFDVRQAVEDVAELAALDRFQASDGIQEAAEYVAERAERAGLDDVRLHRFPADGGRHWWSFRAPHSWTPVRAAIDDVVRYPEQPFALASGSAPTPPGGVLARVAPLTDVIARPPAIQGAGSPAPAVRGAGSPAPAVRGAGSSASAVQGADLPVLAVHDSDLPVPVAVEQAARAGAFGLVTGRLPGPGRVELPPGSGLVAFSVTPEQAAELLRRGTVRVEVETHARAAMPVVTGLLPGAEADEVLLSAHLCHPRPSVNDNASGAAALLGVARALAGRRGRRGVRFVWGPEFTGMAAYLHDVAGRPPAAAVNVDMAGQDQRRCGGPLIVERSPDHLPGFVNALAEHVVAALPQAARSYSGAVACDTWAWRATPFVGASDHSLLVDASVGCPTVTLGHWPDRFNHSAADTLDKLDPAELRRTATVAGACAAVLAGMAGERDELEGIAVDWAAARLLECRGGAPALLRHRTAVALGALDGFEALFGPGDGTARAWLTGLADHVALVPRKPAEGDEAAEGDKLVERAEAAVTPVLCRTWEGPFNLRGLAEAASADGRAWLERQASLARARSYALILALAHGVDGRRDRAAVAAYAEHASGLPVPQDFADEFLAVLVEAGWAKEG
ncbi:DUF4910 domain-containing protein [Nonomuraea sp. NPDC050663]|uniref:DUF4910 domain-containing protein n=1 Tax=Nonomuraea sp. NPDC050663 TaxID=3364370 RepID=UPI003793CB13